MSLRRSSRIATDGLLASNKLQVASSSSSTNSRPNKRPRARSSNTDFDDDSDLKNSEMPRQKRRNKPPSSKLTPQDFPPRLDNPWIIGPHVSSAGGVENAVWNAAAVGANAFAVFLKSQRRWDSNPLEDTSIAEFKARMKTFGYSPSHVLPHGSYLVNLGNPDKEKRDKSYRCFLDDLQRCEQLGLELYNFHPGSTVGAATKQDSISHIADCINRAHKDTPSVVIVLENMAGAGNVIGSRFAELGDIIQQVVDKSRVGVCLDTCHMYAAGYDITSAAGWNETMAEFDRDVGMKYLRGMHLNDSKAGLDSKKDRHENIGLGHLSLRTFAHILSDPRTRNIPLILETPASDVPSSGSAARNSLAVEGMGVWRTEVSVLNRVSGRVPRVPDDDDDPSNRAADNPLRPLEDDELGECRAEIADAVARANKLRDTKVDRKSKSNPTQARRTGRRKGDEREEDGQDDCCSSDQE